MSDPVPVPTTSTPAVASPVALTATMAPAKAPDPGVKTTEFWLALAVIIFSGLVVLLMVYQGKMDGTTALGALAAAGVTSAGYSHGRGAAKSGD